MSKHKVLSQPPSGGCVLKHVVQIHQSAAYLPSRLRAAVC